MSDDERHAGGATASDTAVSGSSAQPGQRPPAPPQPGTGRVGVLPAPVAGPALTLPRPPGRHEIALAAFWRDRAVQLSRRHLAAVAAVGTLGGAALVGNRIGLGMTLVGLGALVTAAPALVRRRAVADLATLGLSGALLVMVSVRAADWVVVLCLLAAAGAAAAALTGARRPSAVLLAPVVAGLGTLRAMPAVRRGLALLAGARRESFVVVLRSVLVTVVLVGAFGALFASADAVFASLIPQVDLGLLPGQLLVGLLVAVLAAGAAHLSIAPVPWPSTPDRQERRRARPGEWLLPIVALDVVVLTFVLVQVGALLGGHAFVVRTAGMTYAGYAREGFGQLVAVTVLSLAVVALAARWAPRATASQRRWSSLALGLLCLGTLGVVASAVRRMALYVDAFGLTRLRITVLTAEIALGVVFLLVLAAGVRWRAVWLPRAVVQVAAIAVLALAAINPDALIVQRNAQLDPGTADARATGIDLSYLQGLSADAVPAADGLDEPLRSAVLAGLEVPTPDGWAGWNLGRARAASTLDVQGGATP